MLSVEIKRDVVQEVARYPNLHTAGGSGAPSSFVIALASTDERSRGRANVEIVGSATNMNLKVNLKSGVTVSTDYFRKIILEKEMMTSGQLFLLSRQRGWKESTRRCDRRNNL